MTTRPTTCSRHAAAVALTGLLLHTLWSFSCCTALSLLAAPAKGPSSSSSSAAAARAAVDEDGMWGVGVTTPDTSGIQEPECLDALRRLRRVAVPVSTNVHPDGQVLVSYARWPSTSSTSSRRRRQEATVPPPVVLVHGFDSSCLEYRRLGPRLADLGIDAYAVDLLGWGFTQLDGGVASFSAEAKVEALSAFVETVVLPGSPTSTFVVAGASLGGAAAIELAAANPRCRGMVLLDAQGFVDGIGPMSLLPTPLAKLGVEVLKSVPLRSSANQMSYYDKDRYATDEAVVIGRLHCLQEGWKDALVSFMQSGGFAPSSKVPAVKVPSLVLWGRQDGILDGKEFAPKFVETLPDAQLVWVEECGHVPHLEQPARTADAIRAFVQERIVDGSSQDVDAEGFASIQLGVWGLAAAGATAFVASFGSDFLPVH
jgi:pimeloyl-ACP methyl ester carboxylesterase